MKYRTILFDKKDRVATITFNRLDKMNAVNMEMLKELNGALEDIEEDSSIRVVVLAGQGEVFCAGADLGNLDFTKTSQGMKFFEFQKQIPMRLEYMPIPVIAAVNGIAFGMGTEFTMSCDIIMASDKARFRLPEVNWGTLPHATLFRGSEVLGKRNILYIAITGTTFSAEEAKSYGMVNKIVQHSQLMAEVNRICDILKDGAPIAQRYIKGILNRKCHEGWDLISLMVPSVLASEDALEAKSAFLEKRKPEFTGR